jgi:ABC-type xylose transport system permease subunit
MTSSQKALLIRLAPQLIALGAILLLNFIMFPQFFNVTIQNGRFYGSFIDVLNRGAPVALLATGMTLVIATKGIDLSVGAVIAICGAVAASSIVSGNSLVWTLLLTTPGWPCLRRLERLPGRHPQHPADHRHAGADGRRTRHSPTDHRRRDHDFQR